MEAGRKRIEKRRMKRILWRQLMMYGLRLGRGWEVNLNFSLVSYSVKQVRDQQQGFWRRVCLYSVMKSCLTLCDPMEHSPPGSSVHEISQASILEWVAISFSGGSSQPRDWTCALPALAGRLFTAESSGGPERSWLSPFKFVLSFKVSTQEIPLSEFFTPKSSQT